MSHVLIIHQDNDTRRILRETLEKANYNVIECANGKEGVSKCREQRIALFITDIQTLKMEGFKIIQDLRKDSSYLKVIAISASDSFFEKKVLEITKELGVNKLLPKPFDKEILLSSIREVLD